MVLSKAFIDTPCSAIRSFARQPRIVPNFITKNLLGPISMPIWFSTYKKAQFPTGRFSWRLPVQKTCAGEMGSELKLDCKRRQTPTSSLQAWQSHCHDNTPPVHDHQSASFLVPVCCLFVPVCCFLVGVSYHKTKRLSFLQMVRTQHMF